MNYSDEQAAPSILIGCGAVLLSAAVWLGLIAAAAYIVRRVFFGH